MANQESWSVIWLTRIDQGWRLFGTAVSFAIFGLGGVLLPVVVIPVICLLPGGKSCRERRTQKVIHYAFRMYIGMMKGLGVLTYQICNKEKLEGAQLILANHPSLIDVVFLIAMVPNANCIIKGKLVHNFFMRGPVRAAGYIINDGTTDVISEAVKAFEKGHALIIFPEGTRTDPLQPLQLKRGAANVAIRTEATITPVLIECDPTTLTKSDRWYHVPKKRVRVLINVKDRIVINSYWDNMSPSKGARRLTSDLQNYFNKELE
ncbi:MAG: lysophospholipid acyltransferase family protein [Motiliproteus sp.]